MYIFIFVSKSNVKNIRNDCSQSFLARSANRVKCFAGVQRWKFIAGIFRKPILGFCSKRPVQQGFTTFSHLWLQLPSWGCFLICIKRYQSTAAHVFNMKVQCMDHEPKPDRPCLEQRDTFGSLLGHFVLGWVVSLSLVLAILRPDLKMNHWPVADTFVVLEVGIQFLLLRLTGWQHRTCGSTRWMPRIQRPSGHGNGCSGTLSSLCSFHSKDWL